MKKPIRDSLIRELKQLPDEMLPEVAKVLTLLKMKYNGETLLPQKRGSILGHLIEDHKRVRELSSTSKTSWAEEIIRGRADRL